MVETEKKIKLEEMRVDFMPNSDDAKMLTLKTEDLYHDAAKIVQAYRTRLFKSLASSWRSRPVRTSRLHNEEFATDTCFLRRSSIVHGLISGSCTCVHERV